MSRADNLAAVQTNRGQAPQAEAVPVVPTVPAVAPAPETLSPQHGQTIEQVMNSGLPGQQAEVPAAEATPAPEAAKEVFKIGTESFDSVSEALEYAQKLDREKLERDAYELGKEEATPKSTEAKVDPDAEFDQRMADLMFENPAEAIKQIRAKAVQDAESTVTKKSEAQQTQEKTWNKFYSDNKDLTPHKDIVDFILQKNWNTLKVMPGDKALQKLSELTKTRIGEIVSSMRTEEVIPSGNAQVTSTTGDPVAQVVLPKQKLDFTQQIRKLGKSRAEFKKLAQG